jgi:integrase/recombinase XerD
MRAAVKHYLVSVLGYEEDDVQELLPKATGRANKLRQALTPTQLALYHAAVEQIDVEPAHTILALLPSTGLRIGEVTALRRTDIHAQGDRYYFRFRGKGDKERIVPLNRAAERILFSYMEAKQPKDWLFTGYSESPIGQHAIRKYTRAMSDKYPDLTGLSPHVLRHTFATMALRNGIDLKNLQVLMGHENISTTQRYLHPSLEDLQDAIDRLD